LPSTTLRGLPGTTLHGLLDTTLHGLLDTTLQGPTVPFGLERGSRDPDTALGRAAPSGSRHRDVAVRPRDTAFGHPAPPVGRSDTPLA
jgi:hypothetical protein